MRNVNYSIFVRRAGRGTLWAGLLVLFLTACGTLEPTIAPQQSDAMYVATVDVTEADSRAAVEAAFSGEVISWHPEAGFAVLTLPESSAGLVSQEVLSINQDAVAASEVFAGGFSAWAGGVSAWAGGVSAWAGGVSAWAGGVDNPFPGNEAVWDQLGLGQAQDLTSDMGRGITVAVIDTGVDVEHSALVNRLASSSGWYDYVDDDYYPHEGYSTVWVANDEDEGWQTVPTHTGDYFGHGTAVAGIILQTAPNAKILPLRVLGPDGVGDVADVVAAIDLAVSKRVQVINLSLGTTVQVAAIDAMVDYATKQGIAVIASSGNSGDSNVTYPAVTAALNQYADAIGVGSVDAFDRKSSFSTYGANLEMLAPGEGIITLFPGEQTVIASGTSFAAPWVSGTAALAIGDARKNAKPTPLLVTSAVSIDALNPSYAGQLGTGRLNSLAAVLATK